MDHHARSVLLRPLRRPHLLDRICLRQKTNRVLLLPLFITQSTQRKESRGKTTQKSSQFTLLQSRKTTFPTCIFQTPPTIVFVNIFPRKNLRNAREKESLENTMSNREKNEACKQIKVSSVLPSFSHVHNLAKKEKKALSLLALPATYFLSIKQILRDLRPFSLSTVPLFLS